MTGSDPESLRSDDVCLDFKKSLLLESYIFYELLFKA